MIDEDSITPAVFEYAISKYRERAEELYQKYGEEFPENDWDLPEEAWQNNYLCWLLFEKVMPETGKTIAEEFAEVSKDMTPGLKMNILQMRNMIRSDFVVITRRDRTVKIKDVGDDTLYDVMLPEGDSQISPNMMITGRIHPFGDHYRFTGIFLVKTTPLILDPDIFMNAFENDQVQRIESVQIRKSSTFRSLMNKYPSHWINWMCDHHGIEQRLKKDKINAIENRLRTDVGTVVDGLSTDAKDALRTCMGKGGFVKYGALKNFDDDRGFFWGEGVSGSPLGELRQKSLLFIGKMRFGDRNYRIAFIPNELRDGVQSALCSEDVPTTAE